MSRDAGAGGLTAERLAAAAERYGTPLYVYDLAGIARRYRTLTAALPQRLDVLYALKANGSLGLCRRLADAGCGADVCSLGELATAGAAGFPRERTSYTGPAKTDAELRAAVEGQIRWVVVESVGEGERLSAIALAAGCRQPVLARLAPAHLPGGCGLLVAAAGSKFGIDEQDAAAALRRLAALPGLALEGIHVYAESCVLDAERLLALHRRTVELAIELAATGLPISTVDLGGGLGVPYRPEERPLDLGRYAAGLRRLIERAPAGWRFVLEPGRYLVAEHGAYVVGVVDVKTAGGGRHVLVDGGIHQLYRPRMRHANRWIEVLGRRLGEPDALPVSIGGPLLSGDDVLAEEVALPPVAVGDRLVIRHCGAYAFSHSLMGFSAHPTPAEVAVDGDDLWLLRRRGSAGDVLRGQYAAAASAGRPRGPVAAPRRLAALAGEPR